MLKSAQVVFSLRVAHWHEAVILLIRSYRSAVLGLRLLTYSLSLLFVFPLATRALAARRSDWLCFIVLNTFVLG